MKTENSQRKLQIKCVEQDHPHCAHGPTLLFYYGDDINNGYYACAAFRDKRKCSFHYLCSQDVTKFPHVEPTTQQLVEKYRKKRDQILSRTLEESNYCLDCDEIFFSASLQQHSKHNMLRKLNAKQLMDPTQFLPPLDDDKAQAQYFFDVKALEFFLQCFVQLNINKIVCIGAPRLHAFLRQGNIVQSFLLDFDQRFYNFFGDNEFAWFNMCNNHFFDNKQQENFEQFLITSKNERLLFFTDPPFGCRTEPIAHTLHSLVKLYNELNKNLHQPLPIFWIFPYYSEHYIQTQMPEMQMCDYKVNYTNHETYTDVGVGSRKLGSPVRLFTNVPLHLFKLPEAEGYKYCKLCQRYTAVENKHCKKCQSCTSKNGDTYRHCKLCGICVKPNYVHCMNCRRCKQTEEHSCEEYQKLQHCWICLEKGHIEHNCAFLKILKPHNATQATKSSCITCYLCNSHGHNERHCRKRYKFLIEETFMGITTVNIKN